MFNKIVILGKVSHSPTLRKRNGEYRGSFCVVFKDVVFKKLDQIRKASRFVKVNTSGERAKKCYDSLKRGDLVYIVGQIAHVDVTKPGEKKKYNLQVLAYNVQKVEDQDQVMKFRNLDAW